MGKTDGRSRAAVVTLALRKRCSTTEPRRPVADLARRAQERQGAGARWTLDRVMDIRLVAPDFRGLGVVSPLKGSVPA